MDEPEERELKRVRCMILKAGSPAIHKLGDIGQSEDDEYIDVLRETDEFYIGSFCEGLGFIDVKFAKKDVRPLNESEVAHLNRQYYCISGTPMHKVEVDAEGYYPATQEG